jgi:transcriptional regulator with XRE-family HTH domain
MDAPTLKKARRKAGFTQKRLAQALDCSQPYLSLMERGKRAVPRAMERKLVRLLELPATCLPLESKPLRRSSPHDWARRKLGELGYPGFRYLAKGRRPSLNPMDVLLQVLSSERCDPRLVEAMPWLLLRFPDLDHELLVTEARQRNVQNRLGFVVALAAEAAASTPQSSDRLGKLNLLSEVLEAFRLAREDDLGQGFKSARLKDHLRENRVDAAAHWNILTDLAPQQRPVG